MSRDLSQDATHQAFPAAANHAIGTKTFSLFSLGVMLAWLVACGGVTKDQGSALGGVKAPASVDTSHLVSGPLRVTGSGQAAGTVAFSMKTNSGDQILTLKPTGELASVGNGLASAYPGATFRVVGMGNGFWVTAKTAQEGQVLAFLNANGSVGAVVETVVGHDKPIPGTWSSAVEKGVVQAGRFVTHRMTSTEAGYVSSGLAFYDANLAVSGSGLGYSNARYDNPLPGVIDLAPLSNGAIVAAFQDRLAVATAGAPAVFTAFTAPIPAPITHVAAGRTSTEVILLAGDAVYVTDTALGSLRAIRIGATVFKADRDQVKRLFVQGNMGIVVDNGKVIRFDLTSGVRQPDIALPAGAVIAAEHTQDKLVLAIGGQTTDALLEVSI